MTPIEKLISYFTQQLSLQQTSNIKYTTEGALIDAIDVCKNALKVEKQYAQQIASLAWDELVGRESKETQTKEQFLNSIFNNQQQEP